MADKIKFALALLLVAAGVAAFYLLSEHAMVLRVLAVVVGLLAGGAVAWFTEPGRQFAEFSADSIVEAKKVVWPSRKETVQTTGIVFAFVVVMAFFLWISDKALEWALYDLILGWTRS